MKEVNHEIVQLTHNLQTRYSYVKMNKPYYAPPHWHESIEILYVKRGKVEFIMGDKKDVHGAGEFCFVGKNVVHATFQVEGGEYLLLQIPYDFLGLFLNDIEKKTIPYITSTELDQELIKKYVSLLEVFCIKRDENGPFSVDMTLKYYGDLFILLSEIFADFGKDVSKEELKNSQKYIDRLSMISEYVKNHYAEPISLSDAANMLSLDEAYFARFFKKYMGVTFMDYVYAIRLKAAAQEIMVSDLTIQTIMEKNGFTNPKFFNKIFYEQYQMKASAFRKSLRKDDGK